MRKYLGKISDDNSDFLIFRCFLKMLTPQTRKKIIFVREPGFGFGNVRTIYFGQNR